MLLKLYLESMKITQTLLNSLTEQAKASPRLRMNYDLRNSPADQSQRRLNAIEPDLAARIRRFVEDEARSCSMDPGCITPEYVCRMWGGSVSLEEIETAMKKL